MIFEVGLGKVLGVMMFTHTMALGWMIISGPGLVKPRDLLLVFSSGSGMARDSSVFPSCSGAVGGVLTGSDS